MLIATRSTVFSLDGAGNASEPEERIHTDGICRVQEGAGCDIVALSSGDIILLSGEDQRRIATGIPDPIESLLIFDEDPLRLLIGTVGAYLYEFVDDGVETGGNSSAVLTRNQSP